MFHNGSNNDYHCIIKKLAEELEEQFECSGENTKNYITFSVPTKKQNENSKTITCKIKFINSVNVMSSSPSSLDDNLAERSHKDKCKNCKSNHEYMTVSNGSLVFKCVECNKNYKKKFDEDLAKRSENT